MRPAPSLRSSDALLPDLWVDWCIATDHNPRDLAEEALSAFVTQATPSKRTMHAVQPAQHAAPRAPAWPRDVTLPDVLQRASALTQPLPPGPGSDPMHWVTELRLHRLRFIAVLAAGTSRTSGLTRRQLHELTKRRLLVLLTTLEHDSAAVSCSPCSMASWLTVLAVRDRWGSRGHLRTALRDLRSRDATHLTDEEIHALVHEVSWPDQPHLIPAIDRWGAVDRFRSLHPSSLSVVMGVIAELPEVPMPARPVRAEATQPTPQRRSFTDAEFEATLADADRVNDALAALLAQYS